MKNFWQIAGPTAVLLTCISVSAWAETRFISDQLVVSLREQSQNGAATITYLRTDTPVEVLEEGDGYVKVRTEAGEIGFIKPNYLTTNTPKTTRIKRLEQERDRLSAKVKELENQASASASRSDQSRAQSSALQKDLNKVQAELAEITKAYEALQQDAKNVLAIKTERDQLREANQDLTETITRYEEEQSALMQTAVIKWFLAGAGVLFFGWIIGKMSGSNRRRSLL